MASEHYSDASKPDALPIVLRLPQELVELVLDYLLDDRAALCASSLIGGLWLPVSSRRLFSRFSWPPCAYHWRRPAVLYLRTCRCQHMLGSADLTRLVTLLRSSPRISSHVRDLRVTTTWFRPGAGFLLGTTSPSEIAEILEIAPCVESLELHDLRLVPNMPISRPAVRSLRSLQIKAPTYNTDVMDFLQLLSSFTHISSLTLLDLLPNMDSEATLSGSLSRPAHDVEIDRIELSFRSINTGARWLNAFHEHLNLASVTSLDVHDPLTTLDGNDTFTTVLHRFVSQCAQLRSLTFHNFISGAFSSYPSPCPTLKEMRFITPVFHDIAGVRGAPWHLVREAVDCPFASAVQDVVLELSLHSKLLYHEPNQASLEQSLRQILEAMDWAVFAAISNRLRSLTMMVKLGRRPRVWGSQGHPIPEVVDTHAYRRVIDDFVRARLSLSCDQEVRVAILDSSLGYP